MKYIFLVSGFAKSGKDLFSDFLCENQKFTKLAFATKLKKDVSKKYGIPEILLNSQSGKDDFYMVKDPLMCIKKGRDILINEAELQRNINKDFYVDYIIDTIKQNNYDRIVISDVRYLNEIEKIKRVFSKDYKILTFRINRYKHSSVNDDSENQLNNYNFDYVIYNYSTIETFILKINEIVKIFFD